MPRGKLSFSSLLNKPGKHSTAAISYYLTDSAHIEASLHISDCNRSITLEFEMYTKSDLTNSFFKINQLRKAIDYLEADLKMVHDKHYKDK